MLARKIGLPPAPVEFCSLLSKPNAIPLKDGVVGVEGALRHAKREAGVIDHNVLRCVPLLLRDRYGGAGIAAASLGSPLGRLLSPRPVSRPGGISAPVTGSMVEIW